MSEFTFSFVQDDQDSFTLLVEGDAERIPFGTMTLRMTTADAVALYEAVDGCIGDFVGEMRAAKREWVQMGGTWRDEDAYALDDPKHPTYQARTAAVWDDREKS